MDLQTPESGNVRSVFLPAALVEVFSRLKASREGRSCRGLRVRPPGWAPRGICPGDRLVPPDGLCCWACGPTI